MSGQIDIKQSLNKAYRKQRPTRTEIELLRRGLEKMLVNTNLQESEEYHKGLLKDFLKETAYSDYFINTKDRKDLVIHNDKSSKSSVGVIIEVKRPGNKTEMPTTDDLNKKAMQELLLYFLRERVTKKNFEIKHLIITNLYEWLIFDASEFEKIAENTKLKRYFKDFEEGRLLFDKTELFYKEIASPVLEQVKDKVKFVHFDIHDYENHIQKQTQAGDNKLIELQKILSPTHLLKLPFANDSNTLNKEFYNELLHIIGMEEYKEKSKKLIRRKTKENRNEDSLIEATITQIISLDKLSQITDVKHFGNNTDEQLFNIGLELVITWINRILFLKLLESQIVGYHKSKEYIFLNKEKVTGYADLNTLFFQVLAVEAKDRQEKIRKKFPKVPYLNSSLFEPTELERQTISISNLPDDTSLPLYKKTVVNGNNEKMNTLEYLLKFLDAYDFASEGKEEIVEDNKTLINASVLGLIYEKINGYRDGSYFTPGFITMYMCRDTIRRTVVQKFKEQTDFKSDNFGDLVNYTTRAYKKTELDKYNEIVNSLKICDPAVGSGHFLVSALNEIIAIKSELGIFTDDGGKPLRDYLVDVENDELMILDGRGEFFKYDPQNRETCRVQKTFFYEKQTIIENCLFGVDINPNSVNICRLRLWIELLKNAYYKEDGELETLPNIDINIKCGNSLISRYPLDANLGHALVGSTWDIGTYRLAVMSYRNAENKEQKREAENLINKIKSDFHTGMTENEPIRKRRKKIKEELNDLTSQGRLFNRDKFKMDKKIVKRIEKLSSDIAKLDAEIEAINSGALYKNAFEWRFEFPEVLDEKTGDFSGFDIVIGNPPYVRVDDIADLLRDQFKSFYKTAVGKYDLYYLFFEKAFSICAPESACVFISPNKFCAADSANSLRERLFEFVTSGDILSASMLSVFEAAANYPVISILKKSSSGFKTFTVRQASNLEGLTAKNSLYSYKTKIDRFRTLPNLVIPINISQDTFDLIIKLYTKSRLLSELVSISEGLRIPANLESATHQTFEIVKQYQFERYSKIGKGSYISKSNLSKVLGKKTDRYEKIIGDKILIAEDALKITATVDYERRVPQGGVYFAVCNSSICDIKFVLGLLNSRLLSYIYEALYSGMHMGGGYLRYRTNFLESLPIPQKLDQLQKDAIEVVSTFVGKILQLVPDKNRVPEVSKLETQIDQLVYKLYNLTPEEIAIVEESEGL
jgi:adenine-specific DNA-methyltransferase